MLNIINGDEQGLTMIARQSLLVRFVISSVETRFCHETVVFRIGLGETGAETIVSYFFTILY